MTQHFYVRPVESTTFKYVQSGPVIVVENIYADVNATVLKNHRKLVQSNDPVNVIFDDKITEWVLNELNSKIIESAWNVNYTVVLVQVSTGDILSTEFQNVPLADILPNLNTYKNYNNNPGITNTKYILKINVGELPTQNAIVDVFAINTGSF